MKIKNSRLKQIIREAVRRRLGSKFDAAAESGDKNNAERAYDTAVSVVDRMANKKIIHKNKAARYKSRLLKHIRAMA